MNSDGETKVDIIHQTPLQIDCNTNYPIFNNAHSTTKGKTCSLTPEVIPNRFPAFAQY